MSIKPLDETSSPLAPNQAEQLTQLIQSLSADQIVWVSGYLAGINAANQDAIQPQAAVSDSTSELTILFGSQTGNAEEIANWLSNQAHARGFKTSVHDMANVRKQHLKKAQNLLVIASTHGEGDPPDNALDLHELLNGPKAPKLKGTRFSVLALGDASYEHFCQTGRDFDERLEALGATRLHPRADCDVDFEDTAQAWIDAALSAFSEALEPTAHASVALSGTQALDTPVYSKRRPFPAPVLDNIVLNARGSDKEVRHIELSLDGSGLVYAPGDSVGVVPSNDPQLVSEVIDALALSPEDKVQADDNTTLEQALTHGYEITTLTRPVVANYAEITESSALHRLLQDEHKAELKAFLQEHHLIDLLGEYPVRGLTAAGLVRLLRKLPPRLYSISSSYQANPDEVHLTVAAVRYRSQGRERKGVASIQLAERLKIGDTVPIYIDHNKNFKPPHSPDTPVIMIGPGTGVAPFRAFLQEREEQGADGRNWLFFGDRRFRSDFLYQAEWLNWRKRGLLTRLDVAFSRDREEKAYVQHRIRENARDVYSWLQEGAHLYVCGDADRMALDVHSTLIDIVAEQGGRDKDAAESYLRELQKSKRYQRDVY